MTSGDAAAAVPTAPVVHPGKVGLLPPDRLRIEPGPDGTVATDPARSGWRYLAFRTARLAAGATLDLDEPERETVVVTIAGGGVGIAVDGGPELDLPGRPTVFEGMPWTAYLPAGRAARITGRPLPGREALIAIAHAPRSGRAGVATEPIVVTPTDVEIEIRGAGNATRQVNNLIMPAFPADRLLVCEVFTPGGNWSGWPPHKHDIDDMPREAVLEETYLYQLARPDAWAIQRVYHRDGTRDVVLAVRSGDLVIVDQGYHPFAATPGCDAYYLNVLAGDRRTMANSDDPDLAWVRTTWPALGPDPRLPLVRP